MSDVWPVGRPWVFLLPISVTGGASLFFVEALVVKGWLVCLSAAILVSFSVCHNPKISYLCLYIILYHITDE